MAPKTCFIYYIASGVLCEHLYWHRKYENNYYIALPSYEQNLP